MYFLLFAVLFVLLTVANRAVFGNQIRVTDVFNAAWCFCAGGAAQGFFGFDRSGTLVSVMAAVTAVVLNLVYMLLCKFDRDLVRAPSFDRKSFVSTIQFPSLLVVHAACYLYSIPYLARSVRVLAAGGFTALRAAAYTDELEASTGQLLIFNWIVGPVFSVTVLMTVVALVLGLKKSGWMVLLTVSDITLYTLLFGGRGHLVKLISFSLITLFFFEGRRTLAFLRQRWKMVLVIAAAFAVATFITLRRGLVGLSVLQNVYAYFAGAFVYLDKLLTAHPVGEYYLWGQATLGFIVSVGWIVAKIFFGVDYAAADNVITGYTAVYYAISPKNQLNAMTTMMYPFLADFGYAGLVIGPAFYATMVMLAERHFKKHGNFSSLCMMVYFFHTLILSMQTYVFFKPDLLFTILFLLLFTTPISLKNGVLVIEKVPRARSLYDDELGGELLR